MVVFSCTFLFHANRLMHRVSALLLPSGLATSVLHSSIPFGIVPAMIDPKFVESTSAQISKALAASPAADIEKNLRALLSAAFARLDLVNREDFEVQKSLLARAQERLAALEALLAEIETRRQP